MTAAKSQKSCKRGIYSIKSDQTFYGQGQQLTIFFPHYCSLLHQMPRVTYFESAPYASACNPVYCEKIQVNETDRVSSF